MLRKLGLGLMAFTIANSSFALELYKAKIISHKESTTGGITASFKSAPLHAQLNGVDNDNNHDSIDLYTNADQQFVKLGEISKIQSVHNISIFNTTDKTEQYTINLSTCVDYENANINEKTSRCADSFDTISIEPQGYFTDSEIPELLIKVADAKPITLNARVEVARVTTLGNLEYIGSSEAHADITLIAN